MLNINTKLIKTTNPVMKKYIGFEGELLFSEDAMAFFYVYSKLEYAFRTSLIQRYEEKNNKLILHTLNSTYSFEKLAEMEAPTTVEFSQNRQKVEDYLKNIKSKKHHCILGGEQLKGIHSIVSFEKAVTRKEALDIITDKEIRDDLEQEIVENIICAADEDGYLLQLKISIINEVKLIKKYEFEKVGLVECIDQFMIGRTMLEHENELYISYVDTIEFFKY